MFFHVLTSVVLWKWKSIPYREIISFSSNILFLQHSDNVRMANSKFAVDVDGRFCVFIENDLELDNENEN